MKFIWEIDIKNNIYIENISMKSIQRNVKMKFIWNKKFAKKDTLMKCLLFVALQQPISPDTPIIYIALVDTPKSIIVNVKSLDVSGAYLWNTQMVISHFWHKNYFLLKTQQKRKQNNLHDFKFSWIIENLYEIRHKFHVSVRSHSFLIILP